MTPSPDLTRDLQATGNDLIARHQVYHRHMTPGDGGGGGGGGGDGVGIIMRVSKRELVAPPPSFFIITLIDDDQHHKETASAYHYHSCQYLTLKVMGGCP